MLKFSNQRSLLNLVSACLIFIAGLGSIAAATPSSSTDEVDRVEPPSWWVGMHDSHLQLMVHGKSFTDVKVSVNAKGINIERMTVMENPHYAVIYLNITPNATTGTVTLRFDRHGKQIAAVPYLLAERAAGSAEREGYSSRDLVYLEVPDRFANGDTTNDSPKGASDHTNRAELFARHGGDLKGTTDHLDYLQKLGVTQLWMTPVFENAMPDGSYHGYAITNHYKIDPHYGTNEDYKNLVNAARAHGIGVIADFVPNHIGSHHFWMTDKPSHDWLSTNDATFITNHAQSSIADPHSSAVDRERFISGWFVDAMPDLNNREPELAKYLIQNAIYWIEYAGLSGLRIDTYAYSDKNFMASYTKAILNEYPKLNIVGEVWVTTPSLVSYWQRGKINTDGYVSNLPSLMDFPLMVAQNAVFSNQDHPEQALQKLYERLGEDFLYPNPNNLFVFADNHDTDRMFTQNHRNVARQKQNLVFIATTRGIPEFVYGDEVLLANDKLGNDGDRRRDFPGGFAGDTVNAFTESGLSTEQIDVLHFTQNLFTWRKTAHAVHNGSLTHYFPTKDVYVYFRQDGGQTVMVALNFSASESEVKVDRFSESLKGLKHGINVLTHEAVTLTDVVRIPANGALVLDLH